MKTKQGESMVYVMAAASIALGAFGQFSMKLGANQVHEAGGTVQTILHMASNVNVIISLGCYAASVAMWMLVLRKLELSIAYPMVSLGYILVFVLSFLLLHEPLTVPKLLGTGMIILGVIVLNIR